MRIFVIGQCTLHWGRMEFGNIGNYYIIEPFFRELHRVFPSASIRTTLQMSDDFCKRENIECVPMELYYDWDEKTLDVAYKELAIASVFQTSKTLIDSTPFIQEILQSDLVVDFSGDIWGENADLVGPNRFLVGLIKDRVAQLLGKPVAMLAGSPGPFSDDHILPFAQEVFSHFDLVTNREPVSKNVLCRYGFDISNVHDLACPAFIFEPAQQEEVIAYLENTPLKVKKKPVIGFVLCGWNMQEGPFNRVDWRADEFNHYVEVIRYMIQKYDVKVCLMSHSNGFDLPPYFNLKKGRDYPIMKQLYDLLRHTEVATNVFLLNGVYSPAVTKGIISNYDMLISGRVHAAVAGLSQSVPTVIIDYGHEPKAHKLRGFAEVAEVAAYVADPADLQYLKEKVDACWNNRMLINSTLQNRNKIIREMVHHNFDLLKEMYERKRF